MTEAKIEQIRMVDDCCLFCGTHGEHAGGHLFIGKRQTDDGRLISDTGWVCIEHQANCAVQICSECAKKIYGEGLVV